MRTIERLTEKQVRNAKPPTGKSKTRLCDGGNLFLHVETNASGKMGAGFSDTASTAKRMTWGSAASDSVGLAAARRRATELREQKALYRVNPLQARNEQKVERKRKAQQERAERARAKDLQAMR